MPIPFLPPTPPRRVAVLLLAVGLGVAGERQPLSGDVVCGTGYDDGVIILPETLALDGGDGGASADVRGRLGWRALRNPGGRLDLALTGGYRSVDGGDPSEAQAGGGATATGALGEGAVTATLDGEHYWLDDAALAWNAGLVLGLALPLGSQVAVPELEARTWRYAELDGADGVLMSARYRHWLPLVDGDPRRRAEFAVEAGRFEAESDPETYAAARVEAGLCGRSGPQRGAGRWDFSAGAWYEHRDYRAGGRERDDRAGASGSVDRWLDAQLAIGLEAGWDRIADQPDGDDLDRLRGALRATAAF